MRKFCPPLCFPLGFSLLEVVLVLGLLAMVGRFAMPQWKSALNHSWLQQHQQGLQQLISQSQAWALLHQQAVVICGWGTNCEVQEVEQESTVIGFVDANGDNQFQQQEQVIARFALGNATVTYNRGNYVRFSSLGATAQSGTWTLCNTLGGQSYQLVLSSSGNLRGVEGRCDA